MCWEEICRNAGWREMREGDYEHLEEEGYSVTDAFFMNAETWETSGVTSWEELASEQNIDGK